MQLPLPELIRIVTGAVFAEIGLRQAAIRVAQRDRAADLDLPASGFAVAVPGADREQVFAGFQQPRRDGIEPPLFPRLFRGGVGRGGFADFRSVQVADVEIIEAPGIQQQRLFGNPVEPESDPKLNVWKSRGSFAGKKI